MIEHKGEKYYTADEIVEKMEEFATNFDFMITYATATQLDEEIKNFIDTCNCWCGYLFNLAQFDGIGRQFNLEGGGDIDSWLEDNFHRHCKLFELGEKN